MQAEFSIDKYSAYLGALEDGIYSGLVFAVLVFTFGFLVGYFVWS